MSLSRRGIFGLFAGAPVVAASVAKAMSEPEPAAKPEFFIGQIRSVVSHYEAVPRMILPHLGHSHSFALPLQPSHQHSISYGPSAGYTTAAAVSRYEQWNGTEWLPIDKPEGGT